MVQNLQTALSGVVTGPLVSSGPGITSFSASDYSTGLLMNASTGPANLRLVNVTGTSHTLSVQLDSVTSDGLDEACTLYLSAVPNTSIYGYVQFSARCSPAPDVAVVFRSKPGVGAYGGGYNFLCILLSGAYIGKPYVGPAPYVTEGANASSATPYVAMWNMDSQNKLVSWVGTQSNNVYTGTPAIVIPSAYASNVVKPLPTGWPTNVFVEWRVGLYSDNNGTMLVEWYNTNTSSWVTAIGQQNMNTNILTGNYTSGGVGLMFGFASNGLTTTTQANTFMNMPFKSVQYVPLV